MKKINFLIAGFVLFLLYSYFSLSHKLNNERNLSNLQAVEISTLRDSVKTVRNKVGQLTFQVASADIQKKQLKDALELAGYDIKSLKEREIQYRKINSILKARLEAIGSITTTVRDTFTVVKTDTVRFQSLANTSNGYLSIFNASIQNQKLNFSYRYNVGFDFFQTTHKNKTVVSVMLTDPNAEIISANSITVTHKKRFFQKPWFWAVTGFTTGLLLAK